MSVSWKERKDALRLSLVIILLAFFVASAVGSVTAQPVELSDAQEIQNIRGDLNGDYVLVDDIDMSELDVFEPIGDCVFDADEEECTNQPFDGSLDGNGHVVSNLTIERDEETDVGLFGAVGEEGSVESLRLEDISVTGNGTVGGLAGTNLGDVNNVHAEGHVEGNAAVGLLVGLNRGRVNDSNAAGTVEAYGSTVGGLVGSNDGGFAGSNNGVVTHSQADVEVVGGPDEVDWVGGLVGANFGGEIKESHAIGDVRSDGVSVGGFVGANLDGEIRNSYAEGDVQSDGTETGGLVGSNVGTVTESRAEGDVIGNVTVGGLVGSSSVGKIDGTVVTGTVSGNEEVGGLVGVMGDERLEEGTTVVLRNSRWEVNRHNHPTVGVVKEGNGEIVIENVTPSVDYNAENDGGTDDGDAGTDRSEANNEEDAENETGDGSIEDDSAEGLPGFSFLTALLALFTAVYAYEAEK